MSLDALAGSLTRISAREPRSGLPTVPDESMMPAKKKPAQSLHLRKAGGSGTVAGSDRPESSDESLSDVMTASAVTLP